MKHKLDTLTEEDPEEDPYSFENLYEDINPRTIANLYWSLAQLKVKKGHPIYFKIERIAMDYLEHFE